jgi:hypothetical protein
MRTFFVGLIIAVAPATAHAEMEVPQFSKGGVLIGIDYGIGLWGIDLNSLHMSVPGVLGFGPADDLAQQAQNTHTLGFTLGYNILGHATIGVSFTATGWNVFNSQRGGSGALLGTVAWHPLELVFLKKDKRPFGLDFSTFAGFGYGILGGTGMSGQAFGMDGFVAQWGVNVDYFFTRYIGLGLFAKVNFLRYSTFYTDWDSAHAGNGGAVALNPSNAGLFSHLGVELIMRVGD